MGCTLAPTQVIHLGVHSLKVTFLSWSRQLNIDQDLRRAQGHHRQDGARGSVALYARDDIHPCLVLQRSVQEKIRANFRPLQPVARGAGVPIADFAVSLFPLDEALELVDEPFVAEPDSVVQEQISSGSSSSSEPEPAELSDVQSKRVGNEDPR